MGHPAKARLELVAVTWLRERTFELDTHTVSSISKGKSRPPPRANATGALSRGLLGPPRLIRVGLAIYIDFFLTISSSHIYLEYISAARMSM